MTLKEIFDEIDSWSKVRVKDDRKCLLWNLMFQDITSTWDLSFMKHGDDVLATIAGTYGYNIATAILDNAGNVARVKRVLNVYSSLNICERSEYAPWHMEANEIVFDADPGTASLYINCYHFPQKLTLALYDGERAATPAGKFTIEVPASNHNVLISGLKYYIETDVSGAATQGVIQQWTMDKNNLIADFNGCRDKDRNKLSINNYAKLNDGTPINAF